jgi:hypothetical protein
MMERMKPEDEGDKPKIEKSTRTKKTKKIKAKEVSNHSLHTTCERAKHTLSLATQTLIKIDPLHESLNFYTSTCALSKFEELRPKISTYSNNWPDVLIQVYEGCNFDVSVDKVTKKSNRIIIINDKSCKKWNTCSTDDEEPPASLGFQVSQSLSSIQNAFSSTLLSHLHQTKHLPSTRNPCYPIPAALRQMFDASSPTLNPLPTGHLTVDSSLRPLFSFPSALSSTSPSRLHHLPLT